MVSLLPRAGSERQEKRHIQSGSGVRHTNKSREKIIRFQFNIDL